VRAGTGGPGDSKSIITVRVGVYGGSFDPPHVGHLILAADAQANLKLDLLLFVPVFAQPLKSASGGAAPPEKRLAMLRSAIGGEKDSKFRVATIEVDRGGLSYTVETLEELARKHPGAELFLIVGEDALESFEKWREPERIRELATLAVLRRHPVGNRPAALPAGVVEASSRLVDLSSSEIRDRVKAGESIRGFVPESVEDHIRSNGLYR
jgi:nicotinate-nucleotide adenylyltransferase